MALLTIASTGIASVLGAQGCVAPIPAVDFGLSDIDCLQCTVHSAGALNWVDYGAEPTVRSVANSANPIQPGDVLVAIDGKLITTISGSRALAHPVAEHVARITVRRAGRQMDVMVKPATPCLQPPPAPATQRAPLSGAAGDSLMRSFAQDMAALHDTIELRYDYDAYGRYYHFTFDGDSARMSGIHGSSRMTFEPNGRALLIVDSAGRRAFYNDNGWGRRGYQPGTFGFTDQPVYSATQANGSPFVAVRAEPDTFYLTAADPSMPRDIQFTNVPSGGTIRIYTSSGILVRVLQSLASQPAGPVHWNARDRGGAMVTSGVFFFNVSSSGSNHTGRMIILNHPGDSLPDGARGKRPLDTRFGRGVGRGTGAGVDSLARPDTTEMNLATTRGWLGLALDCLRCTVDREDHSSRDGTVHFTTPPKVVAVEPGAAELAGFRSGDIVRTIDGLAMTTIEGAQRFSTLRAGERVNFVVERGKNLVVLRLVVPNKTN
jgi:membrane-associated protease RseP (regulator of RpoE activity)